MRGTDGGQYIYTHTQRERERWREVKGEEKRDVATGSGLKRFIRINMTVIKTRENQRKFYKIIFFYR